MNDNSCEIHHQSLCRVLRRVEFDSSGFHMCLRDAWNDSCKCHRTGYDMANDSFEKETIAQSLKNAGYSRRDFLQLCTTIVATAPMGLALTDKATPAEIAKKIAKAKKPSVVWL